MQFIKNTYTKLVLKYGKKRTNIGLIVLLAALMYLGFSFMSSNDAVVEEAPVTVTARTVSLYTIGGTDAGTAVRTTDGNAFIVRAESGGRVERIAKVGDTVERGAVVAQVENSAQRAAVLQAQGAYEAALAGASQSDIGQGSAESAYGEAIIQAQNSYKNAFSVTDGLLRTTVDQVFSQPDSPIVGLRIDGRGQTLALVEERKNLEALYDAWLPRTIDPSNDIEQILKEAEFTVSNLNRLVVSINNVLSDDSAVGINNTLQIDDLRTDFAGARTTLSGVLSSISGARSAYVQAKSTKDQADIGGTNGDVSLADAQVKQALGVLESARAALGKTAIKTPVSGTVTGVSISVGDIIGIGSDVVFVAADGAVETEMGDTVTVPLTAVKFTPSKAFVFTVSDGKLVAHEVKTGSVTTKSITISGTEGITDIVLDVRGLKEGDAVVTQ